MGQIKSSFYDGIDDFSWSLCTTEIKEEDDFIPLKTNVNDSTAMEKKVSATFVPDEEKIKFEENDSDNEIVKNKECEDKVKAENTSQGNKISHESKIEVNNDNGKIVAGSTISRAIPADSISDLIKQHGPNSPKFARAYATNKDSNGASCYIPSPHSYWNVDASMFNLRIGPNYKKNKKKAPSAAALYDLHSFDIIEMPCELDNVEDRFKLPDIPGITDKETGHPDVPPMLVVFCNVPKDQPKLVGNSDNGVSFVSVFCFIISEATLEALKDLDTAPPAIKLFIQWAQRAERDDEFRGRFKVIALFDDVHKLGLPSFITSYNGKPVLINKSGKLKRHEKYIEMSINVFLFNYIAKKSLHSLKPKFPTFVLNVGFTIEGRCDEEQPEILLGGCCLHYLDTSNPTKDKRTGK